VIGATGGSGTRVFARLARLGGLFIGTKLNSSEDAIDFGEYSDCWINAFILRDQHPRDAVTDAMADDLRSLLVTHVADRPPSVPWGWKEPRSIFLLPFFAAVLPPLRFLHVVRDGRDIAFSENQNQPRKHGRAFLGESARNLPPPLRAMALWTRLNLAAADYGENKLGDRYLRVRLEDLCREPDQTTAQVLEFFGLDGDATSLAATEVSPPGGLGRWRGEERDLVSELGRIGGEALARFGY
jgi:Sulfotransferase family